MKPEYSVVLPAYNECEGLETVVEEIVNELREDRCVFEIVIIDDGSNDGTWEIINELRKKHYQIKGLRFARNFGHQLAVHAGIKATSGNFIAIMDSDGQDPADLLPVMFKKLKTEGYDVVNCVRKQRKESSFKRACYFAFYRIYKHLVPFELPLDSGDFSACNRKVADIISSVSQHTPFIRGMRAWAGGKQCKLEYEREARQTGITKYSMGKLMTLALDGITSFSKIPLRISIILGISISGLSIVFVTWVLLQKVFGLDPATPRGWASLACLVSFLGGIILTVLGIIGEYIAHIFDAVRGMPPYRISEQLGFDQLP
jgi:glycosyltransferase involved in cell wall biosynthesis